MDDAARVALRQATSQLHADVEGRMPLSAPSVGLADYRKHLGFMQEWVSGFPAWPAADDHLDGVTRVLNQDIAIADALLGNPGASQAASTGVGRSIDEGAWGYAYVLHGSQLGNQVLYRRWSSVLVPHPLRYLYGDGSDTQKRWRSFLESLAGNVRTSREIELTCISAKAAFQGLLNIVS